MRALARFGILILINLLPPEKWEWFLTRPRMPRFFKRDTPFERTSK